MKNPERVAELLAELRTLTETDFERHRLDVLERDLTSPPTVEVIDDTHQRFDGLIFSKKKDEHYSKHALPIHRAVYTYYNGEIPDGYHIHHVDHNPANNSIENLQCLSQAEHYQIHREDFRRTSKGISVCKVCGKTFEALITGQNKFCSPECHWKANDTKRKSIVKNCELCGREFKTKFAEQRFCSRKCSARSNGIIKICPVCGKEFYTSRSKNNETCSTSCGAKLMWQRRREKH